MQKSRNIIFILLSFIMSCASAELSNIGYQVSKNNNSISNSKITNTGLIISADEDQRFESDYFGVINFSFINTSQEWIHIKNIKIDFGKDEINENIKIISGNDILAWKDSTTLRNNISDYNMNLFLGSLALVGGAISNSSNKNISAAGNAMILGSLTSLTVKSVSDARNSIQYSSIFPQNHLLHSDFIIPPGLFVKKWIVFNSKNHDKIGLITKFDIEYQSNNQPSEKVRITLKDRESLTNDGYSSPWQESLWSKIKENSNK